MAWRYYNFDANWDKVYEVWQGDAVQDVLQLQMEEYLRRDLPTRDEDGQQRRPTWHRGDSLWQYSASWYPHGERMMEAANILFKNENVSGQLLAVLKRHGLDFTGREDQLYESAVFSRAWEECQRRCAPKRGSLESMILFAGNDILEDVHFVLATQLFPDEQIVLGRPPNTPGHHHARVFLCKQCLVFDSQGYWYHKRGISASFACPQPNLSDLVGT